MGSRKNKTEVPPDNNRWATTYSDMITLLLVFFIVLYTLSKVDVQRFEQMAFGLKSEFGKALDLKEAPPKIILSGGVADSEQPPLIFDRFTPPVFEEVDLVEMIIPDKMEESDIDPEEMDDQIMISDSNKELIGIAQELNEKLVDGKSENDVQIILENDLLIIIIKTEGVLFESGSAVLKTEILPTLDIISESLLYYSGLIMVEGHTDNNPINTAIYPSNWELSSGRASAVLRYWVENGLILEGDIVAAGYADTKPADTNDTEEGRARNRRVEIKILSTEDGKKLVR